MGINTFATLLCTAIFHSPHLYIVVSVISEYL